LAVLPKSRRIVFESVHHCVFAITGRAINFEKSFIYLGHQLSAELNDDEDIINRRNAFIGQANNAICYFSKLSSFVKMQLFE
jgi:hypothetical protein